MTKDEVLAMKPGREMDALIAEKIMNTLRYMHDGNMAGIQGGLAMKVFKNGVAEKYQHYEDGSPRWEKGDGDRWFTQLLPHYSTDIAAAWEVFEQMDELGFLERPMYIGKRFAYGPVRCHFVGEGEYTACADDMEVIVCAETAPLAICQAALLAVLGRDGREAEKKEE
jgi:hypothetical protein